MCGINQSSDHIGLNVPITLYDMFGLTLSSANFVLGVPISYYDAQMNMGVSYKESYF